MRGHGTLCAAYPVAKARGMRGADLGHLDFGRVSFWTKQQPGALGLTPAMLMNIIWAARSLRHAADRGPARKQPETIGCPEHRSGQGPLGTENPEAIAPQGAVCARRGSAGDGKTGRWRGMAILSEGGCPSKIFVEHPLPPKTEPRNLRLAQQWAGLFLLPKNNGLPAQRCFQHPALPAVISNKQPTRPPPAKTRHLGPSLLSPALLPCQFSSPSRLPRGQHPS